MWTLQKTRKKILLHATMLEGLHAEVADSINRRLAALPVFHCKN
jgi:hypothetical protein